MFTSESGEAKLLPTKSIRNGADKEDFFIFAQRHFIYIDVSANLDNTITMNNWNKTGKIKATILVLLALPNILMPIGATGEQGLVMILVPLIFGSIAIPLIAKFNGAVLGRDIIKPTWNDNPLTLKRPLSFFYFGSFFFITGGLSMLLGTAIKFQRLSFFGLTTISFGVGILIGIWLTLKWTKAKA